MLRKLVILEEMEEKHSGFIDRFETEVSLPVLCVTSEEPSNDKKSKYNAVRIIR